MWYIQQCWLTSTLIWNWKWNGVFLLLLSFILFTDKDTDMVRCCNQDCPFGSWFHIECLQIRKLPGAGDEWYCSDDCQENSTCCSQDLKQRDESVDSVRNYALALTWSGLLDQCHRDVIREADGLGMMSMWRINFPRFWGGRHYKYMTVAHRMLSGTMKN